MVFGRSTIRSHESRSTPPMHETLVRIPHQIGPLPVFGWGWALLLLVIAWIGWIGATMLRRPRTADPAESDPSSGETPNRPSLLNLIAGSWTWLIVAAMVIFVAPKVELTNLAGEPVGVAIRGYGFFLLVAVASAVGLAVYRAPKFGVDPDHVYGVAPWAFFGGIFGARLFYIIQYFDDFVGDSIGQTIGRLMDFTRGGLVVYGAFIGGGLAVLAYVLRNRMPVRRSGDVIVPCLFLGVLFGRLGCLMHGCCFGAACEPAWYALNFPPGSPVYSRQMDDGRLFGLNIDDASGRIESVQPSSVADRVGIRENETYAGVEVDRSSLFDAADDVPAEEIRPGYLIRTDRGSYPVPPSMMPAQAGPVYPAQLISSIGGGLLCLTLCLVPPGRFPPGTLMWAGFLGYAVLRFGLEIVRVDEAGQFGTSLSISQWVSIVVVILSFVGIALTRRINTAGS